MASITARCCSAVSFENTGERWLRTLATLFDGDCRTSKKPRMVCTAPLKRGLRRLPDESARRPGRRDPFERRIKSRVRFFSLSAAQARMAARRAVPASMAWRLPECRNRGSPIVRHQHFSGCTIFCSDQSFVLPATNALPPHGLLTSTPSPTSFASASRKRVLRDTAVEPSGAGGQFHARFQFCSPISALAREAIRLTGVWHHNHGIIQLNIGLKRSDHAHHTGEDQAVLTVKRNRSDSFSWLSPTAAQAMAIDCGEIIFPVTPPVVFAVTTSAHQRRRLLRRGSL